jgi:heme A synthase
METLLFSSRSISTMVHGMALGGGALMGLSAALFALRALRGTDTPEGTARMQARSLAWLTGVTAALLWLTVGVGTYVTFPPYRATPPEGLTDLRDYPRSLLQSDPDTAWLHSFAMETKEHVPWLAAMLATAVAFVAARYRAQLLREASLRSAATSLLAVCLLLVIWVMLLGVLVNKVAPLQ